jgi:hypothetical protein
MVPTQLQESPALRNLEGVRLLFLSALLAACGPSAPYIQKLDYTPNAGFVNEALMITGSVDYTDGDSDVSQGVIEVSDPNNQLVIRTEPDPIMGSGTSIQGSANFTLPLTKEQITKTGIYHMSVWIVDLTALESNHLQGEIRIATRDPYNNPGNP